jgi:hypothetical protein
MKVRTILYIRADDGQHFTGYEIRHEGKSWLVPSWEIGPAEGTLRPERIICLDGFPAGKSHSPAYNNYDLVLSYALSKDILEGHVKSQSPVVIERPDIIVQENDVQQLK